MNKVSLAGSLRSIKRADVFTKDSIIKVRQPSPSRMAVILAQFGHPHHPKAHSSMLYISLDVARLIARQDAT